MIEIKSTGDAKAFARAAVQHENAAVALCQEDGRLRAFKYLLLRLTAGGLHMDEVDGLRKLGRAVFEGSDATAAAQDVLDHPSATPLAIVIANVALNSSHPSRAKAVLGAVLGAHANTAIMAGNTVDAGLAAFAAVIGAANAESMPFMEKFIGDDAPGFGSRE
jgi:hypothetical protein